MRARYRQRLSRAPTSVLTCQRVWRARWGATEIRLEGQLLSECRKPFCVGPRKLLILRGGDLLYLVFRKQMFFLIRYSDTIRYLWE